MVINCILLSTLITLPGSLAPILSRKRIFIPYSTVIMIILVIYFFEKLKIYNELKQQCDSDCRSKKSDIEYFLWQKNTHKAERDNYLSLCAFLSQAFLMSLCYSYNERIKLERELEIALKSNKVIEPKDPYVPIVKKIRLMSHADDDNQP